MTDTLGVYPINEMIQQRGKLLTIKEIVEENEDEYRVEEMGYTWTNEMFEEVEPKISINITPDNLKSAEIFLKTWQPTLTDTRCGIVKTTNEELKTNLEELEQKIRKEKENKKMNCKDLINIYFNRMEKRILEEKRNKDKKIKENDEIQKLLEDTENQINVMLDRDEEQRYCLPTIYIYTDETDKALIENDKETDRKIEELYQLKSEVEAQLSIIPEEKYEVAIEVLKNYEILDKKGKINV